MSLSAEEDAKKQLEKCLRHHQQGKVSDVELAHYSIMVLATSRGYALVEEFVRRLPPGARTAVVKFARNIAAENWTNPPWLFGGGYTPGERLTHEVTATKEVARLVLAYEPETPE